MESGAKLHCSRERPFVVGKGNYFAAGSLCANSAISNDCVIGEKARLSDVTLCGGNVIGAGVVLSGEIVEQDICVYAGGEGGGLVFVKGEQNNKAAQDMRLAALRKVLATMKQRK